MPYQVITLARIGTITPKAMLGMNCKTNPYTPAGPSDVSAQGHGSSIVLVQVRLCSSDKLGLIAVIIAAVKPAPSIRLKFVEPLHNAPAM